MVEIDTEAVKKPTVLALKGLAKPQTDELLSYLRASLVQPSVITHVEYNMNADDYSMRSAIARSDGGSITFSVFGECVIDVRFHSNATRVALAERCSTCLQSSGYYGKPSPCCSPSLIKGHFVNLSSQDEEYSPSLGLETPLVERFESIGVDVLSAVLAASEISGIIIKLGEILRSA